MKGTSLLCLLLLLLLLLIPLLSLGAEVPERKIQPSSSQSSAVASEAASSQEEPESSSSSSAPVKADTFGTFRILDESSGKVIDVADKEFLYGAIVTEMSPNSETEALKAQGIAAYTYYGRLRSQQRAKPDASLKGADFTANTEGWYLYTTKEHMQKKWGENFDTYYGKLTKIVDAIYGQTLQYDGELICAAYYAISSGKTEAASDIWGGDYSYLTPVASPGDVFASGYQSTVTMKPEEFKAAAQKQWSGLTLGDDPSKWVGAAERTESGSVKAVGIGGQQVKGSEARTAFGLRSQNFTIGFSEQKFTFTVKGYGHGVGMSQVGADYMASQGSNCQEILEWYYPGAVLVKAEV